MTVSGWLESIRMCKFRALLILQRFGRVSVTGIRNVGCTTPKRDSVLFQAVVTDRQWRKRRAADGVFQSEVCLWLS